MNRLKLIGILALAVPGLGLLAFGPKGPKPAPADVTVVEYWEKWTGSEGEAIQQTVDDFNNTVGKEKHIFVRCLSTSGIVQKTMVATAGGVPPDIAGLWESGLAQAAAFDALTPLDDLAAAHGITADKYKKVFWDECHYKGKLYALISTPYCYALYYNKKIFRENADKLRAAGCDPDRPPRTIEELDRYAVALDERNPDGSILRTGYLPTEPGWDLSFWPYNFGGFWWDAKDKKFTFTDPHVVKCFDWMQSYSKRLGKDAVSAFRSGQGNYDSPQNSFLVGHTAMVSQGTFFAHIIEHQAPTLDYAVAPLPVASPELAGTTSCTADVLVIPKGARHPKEAFEFIAWLNTRGPMEKLCNAHCKISPLADVSDDFLKHHSNPYIKVFEDVAASPNAHGSPSIETLPNVGDELANFMTELMQLRTTAADGLAVVQRRMEQKYKDFEAKQALHVKP